MDGFFGIESDFLWISMLVVTNFPPKNLQAKQFQAKMEILVKNSELVAGSSKQLYSYY